MGEPLLNVDDVLAAAARLPDLGITHRRTTISTVGWVPGFDAVHRRGRGTDPARAVAARGRSDARAAELMPVNDRYPLEDVLASAARYIEQRSRRVFVEYVMLAGVNDSPEQARELAKLLGREVVQGEPDPVQPDRSYDGSIPRHDRRIQGRARSRRASRRRFGSRAAATSPPLAASSPRPRAIALRRQSPASRSGRRCGERSVGDRRVPPNDLPATVAPRPDVGDVHAVERSRPSSLATWL